jgi:hypothetical protein
MTKHCVECGELHQRRGNYCKDECERTFNNKKRQERAGTKCRLCNRAFRRPKGKQEQEGAVPVEHSESQESLHV